MLNRAKKPCTRDGCTWPIYAKKLCAGHHREQYPPRPRTPAKPKPPKVRKTPKPRKPLNATRKTRKASTVDDVPAEVRAVVLDRCGGLCEACGRPLTLGVHLHHRLRRRDGGHTADNLVALHPECHVIAPQAVHQRPTWARQQGLIVPSWADPATTPLLLPSGQGVLLHPVQALYLPLPDDLPLAG